VFLVQEARSHQQNASNLCANPFFNFDTAIAP